MGRVVGWVWRSFDGGCFTLRFSELLGSWFMISRSEDVRRHG